MLKETKTSNQNTREQRGISNKNNNYFFTNELKKEIFDVKV